MAYGVLIESKIQAKNIEALNRSAIASVDVAGGGLVSLVAPTTQGEDRWTANTPSSGNLKVAIAYNPSVQYSVVNGVTLAGLLVDPRAYTNIAGKTFDVFLPKVGDEIVITIDAVDASSSSIVAGDYLEPKASQTTFQRIASATGATAGSTSFRVEHTGTITFPNAGIGNDSVTVYKAVCVQE
jgi:hypothetical protein